MYNLLSHQRYSVTTYPTYAVRHRYSDCHVFRTEVGKCCVGVLHICRRRLEAQTCSNPHSNTIFIQIKSTSYQVINDQSSGQRSCLHGNLSSTSFPEQLAPLCKSTSKLCYFARLTIIAISQGNYLHKPIVDPRDSDRFCTCRNPPWVSYTDPVDRIPPLLARIGRYQGLNLTLLLIPYIRARSKTSLPCIWSAGNEDHHSGFENMALPS